MRDLITVEDETNDVVIKANNFNISTQEEYTASSAFLKIIKELQKEVKDTFTPIVKKAHEAHKEAKNQEKKHLDPLVEAEGIVKRKSLKWLDGQEKIRLEAERKAREKAEAEERKRKEELARQQREWEEKERKKREEAEKLEQEGKAEEARKAREIADKAADKAEERQEQSEEVYVPPAPVAQTATKAQGQSVKTTWSAEVTDLMALAKGVAEGKVPTACILANMPVLNKQAIALQDSLNYPGVRAISKKSLSVR